MGIERTLKVGKTYIDVFLDKNLHVYDKNMPGTMTVTNAMSEHYLKEIMGGLVTIIITGSFFIIRMEW